jgi:hypothetical protein
MRWLENILDLALFALCILVFAPMYFVVLMLEKIKNGSDENEQHPTDF